MCSKRLQLVIFILPLIIQDGAMPISVLQNEHTPLAAEISSHLSSHGGRLQDSKQEARLPLPTPQDIETIRRIAEVLVMFGQQVIPAIIGPGSGGSTTTVPTVSDVPNDAVNAI